MVSGHRIDDALACFPGLDNNANHQAADHSGGTVCLKSVPSVLRSVSRITPKLGAQIRWTTTPTTPNECRDRVRNFVWLSLNQKMRALEHSNGHLWFDPPKLFKA